MHRARIWIVLCPEPNALRAARAEAEAFYILLYLHLVCFDIPDGLI